MSLATFGIHPDEIGDRLSYVITMALTVVAFQFIISEKLPHVSYLTLLDKYNLFIFTTVLWLVIEVYLVGYFGEGVFENSANFDKVFGWLTLILFIVGNISFIVYAYYVNDLENNKIGKGIDYKRDAIRRNNADYSPWMDDALNSADGNDNQHYQPVSNHDQEEK